MNMSETDVSYEAYIYSLTEQVEQHLTGLDELREISLKRPLTFNERSATERSIQVLVETAIGCSKHFLKKQDKPVPSESRSSIERVYEILAVVDPDIAEMRGALGMRNAIIHDYLNLDWAKIGTVLKDRKYSNVEKYIKTVCAELLRPHIPKNRKKK